MNRYDLFKDEEMQPVPKKSSFLYEDAKVLRDQVLKGYTSCPVCGDKVLPNYSKDCPEELSCMCDKKSCWESVLPPEMVEKYFRNKGRYEAFKDED